MIRPVSVMCLLCLFACSSDDTGSAKPSAVGRDQDASTSRSDKGGSSDAGSAELAMRDGGGGHASSDTKKGSSGTKRQQDAGTMQSSGHHADDADGGTNAPSGSTHMLDDDAGVNLPESENCCIPHAGPGCNDADIQRCVCDKLDTCCTQAWTAACTYIVTEKFCQPGVRDCVCGSGDGQWQQSACCDAEWTSTCDDVAQIKCGAAVGCK